MRAIRPIIALGLLLFLAAGEAAAQPSDSPRPPPATSPDAIARPPGIQRLEIKPDTPAERDSFLARRRAEMERQKIETATPLPAQRVAPPSGPPLEPLPIPQQR
jgi:hypothetical protein